VDKRSLVLYLSGLAAAGAVVGLAASCSDQPRIKCTAGHGPFAAVYTPMGGPDPCGMPGELIGVEAYNYPLADNSNLDPNRGSLGMQPLVIADEIGHRGPDSNAAHKPYALGDWGSAEPGGDNFCTVPNPNVIEQDQFEVPVVRRSLLQHAGLAWNAARRDPQLYASRGTRHSRRYAARPMHSAVSRGRAVARCRLQLRSSTTR
jgi:hypothetical protein